MSKKINLREAQPKTLSLVFCYFQSVNITIVPVKSMDRFKDQPRALSYKYSQKYDCLHNN